MSIVQQNTDLPSSIRKPGSYFQINLRGGAPAVQNIAKRVLLMGYATAGKTYGFNVPTRCLSQDDANSGVGQGSDLARMYAAAISQVGGGVLDLQICPIAEPSTGGASTYLIAFDGTAGTSGGFDAYVCGYKASISVAIGDTAAAIATRLKAQLDLLLDCPLTFADNASGTLTGTYRHKGVVGEDCPIRIVHTGASTVTVSPGTLTYATQQSGTASATVTCGALTATGSMGGTDMPAVVAASVAAAINASVLPLTAAVLSGAIVTLYYATGRDVRRISAAIVGTNPGTTVAPSVGTAGTGTPTLTTALSNIAALPAFPGWGVAFNETTSMGTISTHIELYSNGLNQKSQYVVFGHAGALAVAGAVPSNSSPALTASPRYEGAWIVDCAQQAYEMAARRIAMIIGNDYVAQNWDGFEFKTSGTVPMLMTDVNSRPIDSDCEAAMGTYHLTPVVVDANNTYAVERAVTTYSGADETIWDTSSIRQLDYVRYQTNLRINTLFGGKNLLLHGTPHTQNTFSLDDMKDQILILLGELVGLDLYDDDEILSTWKGAVSVAPDPVVPTRIDVGVPDAVVRCYHQTGGRINKV